MGCWGCWTCAPLVHMPPTCAPLVHMTPTCAPLVHMIPTCGNDTICFISSVVTTLQPPSHIHTCGDDTLCCASSVVHSTAIISVFSIQKSPEGSSGFLPWARPSAKSAAREEGLPEGGRGGRGGWGGGGRAHVTFRHPRP